MKAVIYVRVSSARQVDNTSLASQEKDCKRWCESHEIEVDRVFVERGESAQTTHRTEYQRMMRYLETVRGHVSHLVVWRSSRLHRDATDGANADRELKSWGIRLVSVTQDMGDADPDLADVFMGINRVYDQYENKTRAKQSLRGMRASFESGQWVWTSPIGYLNEGQKLVPDPERAPLVAQMFELIASGQVRKTSALAQLTRMGLRTQKDKPLTQQTVHRLLTNELYCGRMVAKKWGLRVKGNFEPLVSEEMFDAVQAILTGRAVAAAIPHKKLHEDFPLKGTLRCPLCNCAVTGSISAGKMAARFSKGDPERERYLYKNYRCYKVAGHFSLRAEQAEVALEELLMRMEPEAQRLDAVTAVFRNVWAERNAVAMTELESMQRQVRKLEAKESRFVDLLAEGTLTSEKYKRAIQPIESELSGLRQELAHRQFEQLDIEDAVRYLHSMCWNLPILWKHNYLEKRSSFLKLLFPDGVVYRSDRLEPNPTNSFFTCLGVEGISEEALASPTGFEPVLPP